MITATNLTWDSSALTTIQRSALTRQTGFTIWFTGLSASGKSTIASHLELKLLQRGLNSYRLDGGFSPEDRTENIRRIAEVAKLFADSTVIALTSFISPYRADRGDARKLHEASEIPFVEVHVDIPIEVAEARDPKGLYKRARAGQIKGFTGISAPYEKPHNPEIHIRNDLVTIDEACTQIITYLVLNRLIK